MNILGIRIRWRRPRLLMVGLPLLALTFAANHFEYHWRRQHWAPAQQDLVVSEESGPAGHITLGIKESQASEFLSYSVLGQWPFDPKAPAAAPASVRAFDGKTVRCAGFMYPLQTGAKIKTFCLLRSTQTCCYGPRPQYNQYLLVEMPEAVRFERLTPVIVAGKFVIDPKPAEGYIYRLEGTSVRSAGADTLDLDGPAVAKQTGLPLFDFRLMAELEKDKQPGQKLLALDGKQMVLEGAILDRPAETPLQLLAGSLDSLAAPARRLPTIFNAVQINLSDAKQVPPGWKLQAVFAGLLHVSRDKETWRESGVVRLDGAKLNGGLTGPKVAYEGGPFIPVYVEVISFLMLMVLTMGWDIKD